MSSMNVEKEIALLKQSDEHIIEKVDAALQNQGVHENNDKQRHEETIASHNDIKKTQDELKDLIVSKMMHIEKYVDLKIKEHELWVEKNYAAKTEHLVLDKQVDNIDRRVGKIESVFSWAWKLVFGFIVLGILAVLFGKQ